MGGGIRWDRVHAGVVVGDYQRHRTHRADSLHIGDDHPRPNRLEHGSQDGVLGRSRPALTPVEEPQVRTAATAISIAITTISTIAATR